MLQNIICEVGKMVGYLLIVLCMLSILFSCVGLAVMVCFLIYAGIKDDEQELKDAFEDDLK